MPQVENHMPLARGIHAHPDRSVFRKNAVELELAKCKMDMMSLNSQLLDAIQQKLNLSQQLEAWQVRRALRPRVREDKTVAAVSEPRQSVKRVYYERVPCQWVSSNPPSPGEIQRLCSLSPQGRMPEGAVQSSEPQALPLRAAVPSRFGAGAAFSWSSQLCFN